MHYNFVSVFITVCVVITKPVKHRCDSHTAVPAPVNTDNFKEMYLSKRPIEIRISFKRVICLNREVKNVIQSK